VLLNGTAAEAALLAGDWPGARQWLDEPVTVDPEARELVITHALRALHAALAGDDPGAALAALEELRAAGVGQADASMTFYYDATAGYLAWLAGDHRVAHDVAVSCAAEDPLNEYYLRERGARAALWLGDARLAGAQVELLRALGFRGRANRTSLHTVEAGLAALEGRRGHAIPAYREATAAWRELICDGGLAFALLDMVKLLGADTAEGREAGAELRPLLERLDGRALLSILDGLEASAPAPARQPAPA